jgi:hypothetical protein
VKQRRSLIMKCEGTSLARIKSKLNKVPGDKLAEVDGFIDFILTRSASARKSAEKLEGIWEGLGFDKIPDLEHSIREIRKESEETLLKRTSASCSCPCLHPVVDA